MRLSDFQQINRCFCQLCVIIYENTAKIFTGEKMKIRNNYNLTLKASYVGYVTQAIINNFAPLLYVTFNRDFGLSLSAISTIAAVNFIVQLIIDGLSAKFVDRIGYRVCVVAAHAFAAVGLVALGILPYVMPPFAGIIISIVLYASGSGLIEVLVSPIVEACPTEKKEASMSLLHSFYCWGQAAVILVSTAFFTLFGVSAWRYMSFLWALLPFCNMFLFAAVPINTLGSDGKSAPLREILKNPTFWILAVMMTCAGGSEIAMCQWASAFTESALKVSKTVGDIAGPCAFALLAGSARLLYAKRSDKINLMRFMGLSCALCTVSYLVSALSPLPILSLVGCALCGFASGVLWPGIFSLAPKMCPSGGMAVFALLALAGDLGCSLGPATVGFVAEACGGSLRVGLLAAAVFPFICLIALLALTKIRKLTV